jgi:hypothetical protein
MMEQQLGQRGARAILVTAAMAGLVAGCRSSGAGAVTPAEPGVDVDPPDKDALVVPPDAGAERRLEERDCCFGKNECRGLGNCKTGTHECAGRNQCKGQGGCQPAGCGESLDGDRDGCPGC